MFTQTQGLRPGVRRGGQPDIALSSPRVGPTPHRRWLWQPLVMLLLWSSSEVGAAALPGSEKAVLTVPELIAVARRDNKDLQAARYAIDIARARLAQAGLRPNPRLDLAAQRDFLFNNEGEYASSVGISQEFPIAGRLSRQKDVARVDIALAEAEVANVERRLAGEVASKAYRLVVSAQQVAALETLIAADKNLAKTTRARFRAAEVSEMDVNTVQLDIQRLLLERSVLQSEQQSLTIALNALLGRQAISPLTLVAPTAPMEQWPELTQLQRDALRNRPDFTAALLAIDRAAAEKALAQSTRWQDWTIGLELAQDKQVITGVPSQGTDRAIGISLSIPLPLFNKGQGLIAEAEANQDQADARVEALRSNVLAEVAGAYAEASRLQESLALLKQSLLPIGERNVRLARQGYSMGLIPVFEVMQAQRQLAEANKTYLEAFDQYLQALVRLHTATGDDLDGGPVLHLPFKD